MDILLDWAIQPVGFVACLWVLALVLWATLYRGKPKLAFVSVCLPTLIFWLLATPGFSNFTLNKLEHARDNPAVCESVMPTAPLVVLSGGLDKYVKSIDPYRILSRDSLLRALHAVDLLRNPAMTGPVYISGSVSHERNPSEIMSHILVQNGVDPHRIVLETASVSTIDSVAAIAGLLPIQQTPAITVLTSASHTLRASLAFEQAGYTVCHIDGVDTGASPAVLPVSLLPYLSGLVRSDRVVREALALLVYRLKGYL